MGNLNPSNKILITGGFGFLGSRIATYLSNQGHRIVLGTRFKRVNPNWLPNVEIVQIDFCDNSSLTKILSEVDLIIHAAGMNSIDSASNPQEAFKVNGDQTREIVKIAHEQGVDRFIYLSTAHVYRNPLVGKIDELTKPENSHPYALSHLAGELAVIEAHQQKKLNSLVLRLSNIFGYPGHFGANCWTLLVNDICKQVTMSNKITLQTNGSQKRNFLGAHRLCLLIEKMIAYKEFFSGGVINVGSEKSISVLEMACLVRNRSERVLGYRPDVVINNSDNKNCNDDLVYQSQKIELLRGEIASHLDIEEIDSLLKYCKKNFTELQNE